MKKLIFAACCIGLLSRFAVAGDWTETDNYAIAANNFIAVEKETTVKKKIEELYKYVRENTSDNKPFAICTKMRTLFPDIFKDYKTKPFSAIPEK